MDSPPKRQEDDGGERERKFDPEPVAESVGHPCQQNQANGEEHLIDDARKQPLTGADQLHTYKKNTTDLPPANSRLLV